MESKVKLKVIDITSRTCCYFENIKKFEDIDFHNILLDKKSYENILIYGISCKMFMGVKPSFIKFDEGYGVSKMYDGTRYLELFGSWFYHRIFDRTNDLICGKSNYKYSINHNFSRIRIDSYNSLPLEEILTFQNVVIVIK